LIEDDGCEGNLFDGKVFQKAGEGGTSYVGRVGMSGHFLVPETVAGGFGKEILVFGLSHLLIVDQSRGIPVLTLPSPEYRENTSNMLYIGMSAGIIYYQNERSKYYPVFV
jgi:hypothetical protein